MQEVLRITDKLYEVGVDMVTFPVPGPLPSGRYPLETGAFSLKQALVSPGAKQNCAA